MVNTMMAQQIVDYKKPLETRAIPVPGVRGEEVLLKIEGSGLCHSDIQISTACRGIRYRRSRSSHRCRSYSLQSGEETASFSVSWQYGSNHRMRRLGAVRRAVC